MKYPDKIYPIDFAGFFDLKDDPYYEGKSLLNVDDYPEAKEFAEEVCRRWNSHAEPTNGEQSAFPIHGGNGDDPRNQIISGGISKREYFAAKAMQGLLASHPDQIHNSYQGVSVAITWADELLKRLEQ